MKDLCEQCMFHEDSGNGMKACWAPDKNFAKSHGKPNARICGYKNIKFGERCYTRSNG